MKLIIYAILAVLGYYLWKKYRTGATSTAAAVSPNAALMRVGTTPAQRVPHNKPFGGTSATTKIIDMVVNPRLGVTP
jgi:hypothetical protein